MRLTTRRLVYPEGDVQEIEHRLSINELVDLNGAPLELPLPTARMIVYRVFRICTQNLTGEDITDYHLELVWRDELERMGAGQSW
jgi:hypothetical protein